MIDSIFGNGEMRNEEKIDQPGVQFVEGFIRQMTNRERGMAGEVWKCEMWFF